MSPTGLLDNYIASHARENLPYSAVLSVENRPLVANVFTKKEVGVSRKGYNDHRSQNSPCHREEETLEHKRT